MTEKAQHYLAFWVYLNYFGSKTRLDHSCHYFAKEACFNRSAIHYKNYPHTPIAKTRCAH